MLTTLFVLAVLAQSPTLVAESAPLAPPPALELPDAGLPRPSPRSPGASSASSAGSPTPRPAKALIEATVKVVSGAKKSGLTDVDGNFKLKLPPGVYSLRIFNELYEARRIDNVAVKASAATRLDVELSNEAKTVQEVVVEAKVDKRNEAALLAERKKAAVVSDTLGAQEMARTPDSSASDAVKRVVSATVVDGRYVFLRGLGGRYAQTLINGTLMPSPEPDEPSVPLDLFPVALISNLSVAKTYSPELPATFGGGSLTLDTPSFPPELELKLKATFSGDTVNLGQRRPDARLSAAETLGFRDGSRGMPASVPQDGPLLVRRGAFSAQQQQAAGRDFKNEWTPQLGTGLPSGTFSAQAGDTVGLGGGSGLKLGWLAALQWSRRERAQNVRLLDVASDSGELVGVGPTSTSIGAVSGNTSALLALGLQSSNFELGYVGLLVASNEATTTESFGFDAQAGAEMSSSRLAFVQRQVLFNQLRGFHRLPGTRGLELEWQLNFSQVDRSEPDVRDLRSLTGDDGLTRIRFQPNSAERFYLGLNEGSGGGTAHLTIPLRSLKLKVGALGQGSARSFDARRFRIMQRGPQSPESQVQSAEAQFQPEHLGPYTPGTNLYVEETTLTFDRYRAQLAVWGGFALADWKPLEWLRVIGGVRYEGSAQSLEPGSPFATSGAPVAGSSRTYHDAVPSLNLVLSPRPDLNLRLAYAYTLARPTFRELAPFLFFDVVRRRNVTGNPELTETRIHHADARLEWFPGAGDVVAVTAFGKQFVDPIERVIVSAGSTNDLGYRNAPGATLVGLELEARKTLGDFHVGANLSLVYSRVQLGETGAEGLQTSNARALQGQSPYVANAFVSYQLPRTGTELGVFYNVYGPRISEVGVLKLPDVFEQPFHRLDVSLSQPLAGGFALKVSASNLLAQAVSLKQGPVEVYRSAPGVQFFASVSWALNPAATKEVKP
ncbi:MAG: TonB-dependent receptor [Archangiaceae bacterium]|nr:TonB-dependent receptor [Archangiaceae bacterium]